MAGDALESEYERLSRSEPAQALEQLQETLGQLASDGSMDAGRGRILRHAALAARSLRDLGRSQELINEALELAHTSGDDAGLVLHNLTKGYNHFLAAEHEQAIALVSSLDAGDDLELQTMVDVQLATIYGRIGWNRSAIETLDNAINRLNPTIDRYIISQIYKNRGMFLACEGRYSEAVKDAETALEICEELGLELEIAFCKHNIGLAASYAGDLPRAFAQFTAAEQRMRELTGSDFEAKAGHCRALISAGLFTEAAKTADAAADDCDAADYLIDGAETRLLAASAWLEAGETDAAADRAERARRELAGQGRMGWAASASLVTLAIEHRDGRSLDLSELDTLIGTLRDSGLKRDLAEAELLRIETLAAHDELDRAVAELDRLAPGLDAASSDLRLAGAAARSLVLSRLGDGDGANQVAEDGYRLLAEQQTLLGAADLRVGLRQHGQRLGHLGLSTALSNQDPSLAIAWLERVDLAASTPRPVRPPPNPELQIALGRLRALGADDTHARVELEEQVRSLDRANRSLDRPLFPLPVAELTDRLGEAIGISLGEHDGQLIAAVLGQGPPRLVHIGQSDRLQRLARSLRADLRTRALNPKRAKPDRILRALREIETMLQPLELQREALVISPTTGLMALPWAALPGRVGSPTSVVASLTAWAVTPDATQPNERVFIAGPELEHADREVRKIAVGKDTILAGDAASVESTLAALETADLAHIAAHGKVREDNPLFSSLKLTDANLSVYEIGDLRSAPSVVVLSACHVGLPAQSAGKELLGMVTGFLNAGTSCVIASSLPVADHETTVQLMGRFHSTLESGLPPATAWAEVQRTSRDQDQLIDTATFTLFGRG